MNQEHFSTKTSKVTSVLASAAIVINGFFSSALPPQQNQVQDKIMPPSSIEFVVSDYTDDDLDDIIIPEEEKKKRKSFIAWYSNQRFSLRLIIAVAIVGIIMILASIVYFNISPLLPSIVKHIMSLALSALIGLSAYLCIFKAVSPATSVKKIMSWRNILAVVIISCALFYGLKFLLLSLAVHT